MVLTMNIIVKIILNHALYVMEMGVNRATSTPKSVLRYLKTGSAAYKQAMIKLQEMADFNSLHGS